ncbi:CvpA family protein [Flavobacteriales bacterium]|mgnify:FL=1|jgi:membrane protein required for colicin V production|nr:CvpA family protein [Flavobacteriales bacterium]
MNMSNIGALDAIIGVALAWALFRGFQKGFIVKIASLIALVAGTFAGFHGSEGLANWLKNEVNWSETSVQLTAFILTFILVVIGVHFLAKLIEKMVDLTALGLINKLAGMALGAFQMVLLLSITTFALDGVFGERNWLPAGAAEESVLYPSVETAVEWIIPEMNRSTPWDQIRDRMHDEVERLQDKVEEGIDRLEGTAP